MVPLLGGRITSPRASDKERQARKLHISRHDIAGLASSLYHGGRLGVQELSLGFIHACGYQLFSPEVEDDVLPCYGMIQLLHKKVKMAWTNPRTLQSGPSVERILEKGLTVFPKLRVTSARDTVAFYESLQQVFTSYLLPVMPFDTICLANNYEGLFPPGLGTDAYCECCSAMLEVLPRLIPTGDYEVDAKLSSIRTTSRNGYDLLWRILELFVPGFDPTIPIAQPVWTPDSSILDFCQSHMLYFHLQAKKNMFFSSRDRTTIFLCAVTPSEYADVITNLQTSADAYRHPDNDGILPDHLQLDGIATLIHNNAKHRVRDLHSPWVRLVAGVDTMWDAAEDDKAPFCHLQGYTPRLHRLDGYWNRGDDAHRNCGALRVATGFKHPALLLTNPKVSSRGPTNVAAHTNLACNATHARGLDTMLSTAICWRSPFTSTGTPKISLLLTALPSNLAGSINTGPNSASPAVLHARSCVPFVTTTTLPPAISTRLWTGIAGPIRTPTN